MMNSRLIRQQDARLYFDVMAWLIKRHGPPLRPSVPSPIQKINGLENLAWNDQKIDSVIDWARDHFDSLKTSFGLQDKAIELHAVVDDLNRDQLAANRRLDALAAGQNPYHNQAQTLVYYDPRDCAEPGHFAGHIILQLAELHAAEFQREENRSPLTHHLVTLASAAYARHGFTLASLPHIVSAFMTAEIDTRPVPNRSVIHSLCFATCLALRVKRQSPEQIIAAYGQIMPHAFRRKVKQACRQIDSFEPELAVLQMLSDTRPQPAKTPYQLPQTG